MEHGFLGLARTQGRPSFPFFEGFGTLTSPCKPKWAPWLLLGLVGVQSIVWGSWYLLLTWPMPAWWFGIERMFRSSKDTQPHEHLSKHPPP